ncbi:DUF2254 domain-containing protein [Nocardioides donggukensis]|uniref:DUF2254 domain-containing protein n=1 Tax=Nocardioides donggukensis TaxID=2774019 RepID=A0A927Q0W9_9ACTN|nr:DUF2254 domain-containing protein [Nocardioides donggukensis]MBD8868904.1 DUF2254 domain-containing protein [Nocardioides donggukensis]
MTPRRPSRAAVPTPSPTAALGRTRPWFERAFDPFWVVPALWCLGAVVAAVLIPAVEGPAGRGVPLLFDGGPAAARNVLSTIAGAMISVTGLVFSITIVVLQLASSQFSPRVLNTFLDDPVTQHTLGVFASSFVYALTVLRAVRDAPADGEPFVPRLAVTVAYLLVLAAVGMFLAFIHHITQSISVSTITHRVADQTRDLIERSRPSGQVAGPRPELPDMEHQTTVVAQRSGYLDSLDLQGLQRLARRRGARLEVLYPLGSFLPEGAPAVMVRTQEPPGEGWDDDVAAGLGIARERTMHQDPTYGFRRLVDIAERALSPGINDPTTAVQVIDELHDVLRRMAATADPWPVWYDEEGTPRLVTTEWTFAQYLDLAVDEIAHWGADGLQVPARLREMLVDLQVVAGAEHRETVVAKLNRLGQTER